MEPHYRSWQVIEKVFEALGLVVLLTCVGCGRDGDRKRLDTPGGITVPRGTPIIWINVDTFAAKHSNVFGYGRETTPALARLATEAIVFDHCRANATWTLPSTISQLTGILPLAFHIEQPQPQDTSDLPLEGAGWLLPEARWTLAEILSAGGYATAAFIDNPYLHRGYGVAQGFDVWDTASADVDRSDPEGGLAHMQPRMLAWLDELDSDRPFLLFGQPFDPHGPYVPSEVNRDLFAGDGFTRGLGDAPVAFKGASRGAVIAAFARYHPDQDPAQPLPQRVDLGPMVDAYDRSLRTLDDALGQFIEALRARDILDRAVLIVSSDHGESTVGHEALFEHKQPWEDVLHVPLLIRLPGAQQGGRRVSSNVQGVDIFPTLLEIAGYSPQRDELDGISLVGALMGDELPERDHFAYGDENDTLALIRGETKLHYLRPKAGNPYALLQLEEARRWRERALDVPSNTPFTPEELLAAVAAREDSAELLAAWHELRGRLVQPRSLLFDLSRDGGEQKDLSTRQPELASQLQEAVLAIASTSRAAQADAPLDEPRFAPDADLLHTLRGLGYGGDSSTDSD